MAGPEPVEGAPTGELLPGSGAWLCGPAPSGPQSLCPRPYRMAGVKALLYGRPTERDGAQTGIGDKEGDVAKGLRPRWRSRGWLSIWDMLTQNASEGHWHQEPPCSR